jgi:oligoribonuclease (3'-5' exoribonuclease)
MAYTKTYSKFHPGKYGLLIDWETTGAEFGTDSSKRFQGIAFGAIIFNTSTFEEVESIYREVQYDATKYEWTETAEKIHGLSREHLAANGVTREQACVDLFTLILKYIGAGNKVLLAGHNCGFDADFTNQLATDHGIDLVLHHVMLDSSSLAFALITEYKSDVVFELLGGIDKRGLHNALEDARASLAVFRNARQIFEKGLFAEVKS